MDLFTWEINELVKKLEYHFLHQIFVIGHLIFLLLNTNTCFYLCIPWLLKSWSTTAVREGLGAVDSMSELFSRSPQERQGQAVLALVVLGWLRVCHALPRVWVEAHMALTCKPGGFQCCVMCFLISKCPKQCKITGTAHSQTKKLWQELSDQNVSKPEF